MKLSVVILPDCQAGAAALRLLSHRLCKRPSGRNQLDQNCTLHLDLEVRGKIMSCYKVIKGLLGLLNSALLSFLKVAHNSNITPSVKPYQAYWNEITMKKKKFTFFVEPTNYVVNVVWEKTPAVQDGRQHCCNSSTCHGLVICMLVHLSERNTTLINKNRLL